MCQSRPTTNRKSSAPRPLLYSSFVANATLKRDPTGTTAVRRKYEADVVRRFKRLKKLVRETVVTNDALGIKANVLGDARPGDRFIFERSESKLDAFIEWLNTAIASDILEETTGIEGRITRTNWQTAHLRRAMSVAIDQVDKRVTPFLEGFGLINDISAVFNQPVHAELLGILATRNYELLKGITQAMSSQMAVTLSIGMARGLGAIAMAKQLTDRIDAIGIARGRTMARTEVINAHAETTLNRYQQHGVKSVGAAVEFSTANDPCPVCERLEGGEYSIQEARGVIPVHPNCRCAWLPVIEAPAFDVALVSGDPSRRSRRPRRRKRVGPGRRIVPA